MKPNPESFPRWSLLPMCCACTSWLSVSLDRHATSGCNFDGFAIHSYTLGATPTGTLPYRATCSLVTWAKSEISFGQRIARGSII